MRVEQFVPNTTISASYPVWDAISDFDFQFYSSLLKVINHDLQCPRCLRNQTGVIQISDDAVLQTAPGAPGAFDASAWVVVLNECHFCLLTWYYRYVKVNVLFDGLGALTAP